TAEPLLGVRPPSPHHCTGGGTTHSSDTDIASTTHPATSIARMYGRTRALSDWATACTPVVPLAAVSRNISRLSTDSGVICRFSRVCATQDHCHCSNPSHLGIRSGDGDHLTASVAATYLF